MSEATSPQEQTFETLIYTLKNHVATVTLNRPEARNALNRLAYAELEAVFRSMQADPQVRCIISPVQTLRSVLVTT
jgi:enoyl-CoA hydratase/carnithine racemase